jgi:hypothetical protein
MFSEGIAAEMAKGVCIHFNLSISKATAIFLFRLLVFHSILLS